MKCDSIRDGTASHDQAEMRTGGVILDDLEKRAERAIEEVIMPYVRAMLSECPRDVHVAIASHGLLIAEMVPLLLRLSIKPTEERGTYRCTEPRNNPPHNQDMPPNTQ